MYVQWNIILTLKKKRYSDNTTKDTSEINQSQKDQCYLQEDSKVIKCIETESRTEAVRAWGKGGGNGSCLVVIGFQFNKMKKF